MKTRFLSVITICAASLMLTSSLYAQRGLEFQLDHFKVYAVKSQPASITAKILLRGQFDKEPRSTSLGPLTYLANPVSKNGSKLIDKNAHLAWHTIKGGTEPKRSVTLENQFGKGQVLLGEAVYLAVPTEKVEKESALPKKLDHFKCYNVLEGKPLDKEVSLDDQFDKQRAVKVLKPVLFCVPVMKVYGKQTTEIQNPRDHLIVYDVAPKKYELTKKDLKNQFGKWSVSVTESKMLAVPSKKLEWSEVK
jgi:hypothetical protein